MSIGGKGGFSPPWLLRALFVLLCLTVRLAALDADPPAWLSWDTGLYTDEGFYTLDARHQALFGTNALGDFHDRLLSPLLSLLQLGVFRVFGVGIVQARGLSVLFGLLTVGVFWLGLRRAFGTRTADGGALFLGLAPPFALYNRTALQETPAVFWLVLAFALWAYAARETGRRQAVLFALAGFSVGTAMLFKGLALLAAPALLAPPAPNSGGAGKEARGPFMLPQKWGGFLIALALYALLWYEPHHAELSRMGTYYRVHQLQPHSWHSAWLNIRRGLIKGERGVVPYLLATLPVPCLLAGWGVGRRRPVNVAEWFLLLWLAGGLLFCLLSSYAPSRYYVLFLPALAGLAARGLAELRRPLQVAAISVFLLGSALWYGAAWNGRSFAQRDASREIARTLPPGSVVIGDFAPILCLNTPFAATTVQPGLANYDQPVERLGATHVVVVRNARDWQDWWRMHYPALMQPAHQVASFDLGGARHYVVDVYAVKEAR